MKRIALPLGFILVLSLTSTVTATAPTPADGAIWNPGQLLEYRWRDGNEPPGWLRPAINAAAQDATQTSRADTPTFRYDSGGPGWISYTSDIPSTYAVAFANRNVPSSYGIRLRPQGYALDWGTLRWCQFYDSPPTGCYDAEMITLHEFGHVLTLNHPNDDQVDDWLDTVMHWAPKTRAKVGWNEHDFGRCDVARLQMRYDTASASSPISTCLALSTQLTLAATPSSRVDYGSTIVLTATLRVSTNADEQVLAGNLLDGRTVRLQRRALGAEGWTDLGAMADSGVGRYSRSLVAWAAYEYRARFDAPGNEGLRDSASPVVRISIDDPCVSSADESINAPTC